MKKANVLKLLHYVCEIVRNKCAVYHIVKKKPVDSYKENYLYFI